MSVDLTASASQIAPFSTDIYLLYAGLCNALGHLKYTSWNEGSRQIALLNAETTDSVLLQKIEGIKNLLDSSIAASRAASLAFRAEGVRSVMEISDYKDQQSKNLFQLIYDKISQEFPDYDAGTKAAEAASEGKIQDSIRLLHDNQLNPNLCFCLKTSCVFRVYNLFQIAFRNPDTEVELKYPKPQTCSLKTYLITNYTLEPNLGSLTRNKPYLTSILFSTALSSKGVLGNHQIIENLRMLIKLGESPWQTFSADSKSLKETPAATEAPQDHKETNAQWLITSHTNLFVMDEIFTYPEPPTSVSVLEFLVSVDPQIPKRVSKAHLTTTVLDELLIKEFDILDTWEDNPRSYAVSTFAQMLIIYGNQITNPKVLSKMNRPKSIYEIKVIDKINSARKIHSKACLKANKISKMVHVVLEDSLPIIDLRDLINKYVKDIPETCFQQLFLSSSHIRYPHLIFRQIPTELTFRDTRMTRTTSVTKPIAVPPNTVVQPRPTVARMIAEVD